MDKIIPGLLKPYFDYNLYWNTPSTIIVTLYKDMQALEHSRTSSQVFLPSMENKLHKLAIRRV